MRLLITGITGFVGSHMAEYALSHGAEVFGSARWRSRTENVEHLRGKVQLVDCDLRDSASVRHASRGVVHREWDDHVGQPLHLKVDGRVLAHRVDEHVERHVFLEGLRELKLAPRFLVIGTSEEYGLVHADEVPITESNPLRPLSPYAVSKVSLEMLVKICAGQGDEL